MTMQWMSIVPDHYLHAVAPETKRELDHSRLSCLMIDHECVMIINTDDNTLGAGYTQHSAHSAYSSIPIPFQMCLLRQVLRIADLHNVNQLQPVLAGLA